MRSRRRRPSSSALTWAQSTWSCRLSRRRRWRADSSASDARGIGPARSAKGSSFQSFRRPRRVRRRRACHARGAVEPTRYPRNPLDVLAQIVAMVATEEWATEDLFAAVRCAAPFATLSRRMFEGVLDMLAGRYPRCLCRAAAPRHMGSRPQQARRTGGCQAGCDRECRHDS